MLGGLFSVFGDLEGKIAGLIANVEQQRIAIRLEWKGKLLVPFHGMQPNGRHFQIGEHLFYQFEHGKIARAWTLLDWFSMAQQNAAPEK